MLSEVVICLIVSQLTYCQLNGEFWWLNSEVNKLKSNVAPTPHFEELTEFDTDESSKITFREEELIANNRHEEFKTFISNLKPNEVKKKKAYSLWTYNIKNNHSSTEKSSGDSFVFRFPKDDNDDKLSEILFPDSANNELHYARLKAMSKQKSNHNSLTLNLSNGNINDHQSNREDNIILNKVNMPEKKNMRINEVLTASMNNSTENICTYMKKTECYEKNGRIYLSNQSKNKNVIYAQIVCCNLSKQTDEKSKIIFPDNPLIKRNRRSTKDVIPSINQREFLVRNKFGVQNVRPTPNILRVVTPDEDGNVDPYWNIKNDKFEVPYSNIKKADCEYKGYDDDYVSELPKPGLISSFFNQGSNSKRPVWINDNDNPNPSYDLNFDYSDEDEGTVFGYSTVDPRKVTSKTPNRGRPIKLTTTPDEEEVSYDIESQTINFQSNPNFQVLQGFKLLNLARSKNKFYSKNTRRATTESSSIENQRDDSLKIEVDNEATTNCGRTVLNKQTEEEIGDAVSDSYPWLAVVVSSVKPEDILCYATIVHPRAAITAGDCVSEYNKLNSKKEAVVIVTGLRQIKDRQRSQNRIVTVQLHPQWKRGILAHNLALMHWKRPLRLNSKVQPACLAGPQDCDDCRFFGWGGFDQAMRSRVRWQKATLVPSRECSSHFTKPKQLPSDAFCTTVQSRGTVTGLGGSLICNYGGRAFSTGVAMYRDNAMVLIPAHEWILRAIEDLNIE